MSLSKPEREIVTAVQTAYVAALGEFASAAADRDFDLAERWAAMCFRLVEALDESDRSERSGKDADD